MIRNIIIEDVNGQRSQRTTHLLPTGYAVQADGPGRTLLDELDTLNKRVKELEHLLSSVYGTWPLHGIAPELEERIKTILNKKP